MNITDSSGRKNGLKLYRLVCQNVAIGGINGLAALMGFSCKKMYGCFVGTKLRVHNI